MKLTPLNLVSSICLVAGVMLFFKPPSPVPAHINTNSLLATFYLLTAIIAFISDLIFRKFIPLLRKLWVVEGLLIVFTIALMLILKSAIS